MLMRSWSLSAVCHFFGVGGILSSNLRIDNVTVFIPLRIMANSPTKLNDIKVLNVLIKILHVWRYLYKKYSADI